MASHGASHRAAGTKEAGQRAPDQGAPPPRGGEVQPGHTGTGWAKRQPASPACGGKPPAPRGRICLSRHRDPEPRGRGAQHRISANQRSAEKHWRKARVHQKYEDGREPEERGEALACGASAPETRGRARTRGARRSTGEWRRCTSNTRTGATAAATSDGGGGGCGRGRRRRGRKRR